MGALDGNDTNTAAILVDTGTTLDALIKQKGGRLTLVSNLQETVVVNATAGDKSLPSIAVPSGLLPTGASMTRALAGFSFRKTVESSTSTNATVVAQVIEVDITGGFATTAIDIPDNSFHTAGSATEAGMLLLGDNDVKAEVTEGSTTTFQWTAADVDGISLTFHDVQMHLFIDYE